MSNVEKLKKKAAEFEQKKQFDRALEVYLQIIGQTEGQEDRDVTVYNRVGDLYLRLNKTDQAVNYYEQAVDLYTEGGYLNNAIALCNKILRHAPQRHQIYYKLGKISAKKGFNSDAKKNFLEYADRMHRSGKDTDAFKALQEFADLCPGQDDIRLMLADQLAKAGKNAEAIEQLQILHESLDAEGRSAEAEATVQRIKSLDPTVEPRRSKTPVKSDAGGLVFLDVGGSPSRPMPKIQGLERTSLSPEAPRRPPTPPRRPATPHHIQPAPEIDQLQDLEPMPDFDPSTPDSSPALEIDTTTIPGLEPTASGHDMQSASALGEIEPAFDLSVGDVDISPLEGLESAADPQAFAIDPEASALGSGVEGLISSDSGLLRGEPGLGEPLSTEDPLAGLSVLEDDRLFVHEPVETSASDQTDSPVADEAPGIDTIDFGIEHTHSPAEEVEKPAPQARAAHAPPARPRSEQVASEEEEPAEEDEERNQPLAAVADE